MSWGKALIVGFFIYFGSYVVNFIIFVSLGLGYKFSNLANKISEILAFPAGTGKNYSFILSALFWTVVIATVIKIISPLPKK